MKATDIPAMEDRIARFKELSARLKHLQETKHTLEAISGNHRQVGDISFLRFFTNSAEDVGIVELQSLPVTNYQLRGFLLQYVVNEITNVATAIENL